MMQRILAVLVLVTVIGMAIVVSGDDIDPNVTVNAWLLCDECSDGELEKVLQLGDRAIPLLTTALDSGPSAQQRENIRKQLRGGAAAVRRTGGDLIPGDSADFFKRYVDSYVETYRQRAFHALRALNSAAARDTLDSLVVRSAAGWTPALQATAEAYRSGVTDVKILPIENLITGNRRKVRVNVVGGDSLTPLTWTSDKPLIATVDAARILTGHSAGTARLTACYVPQAGTPICGFATAKIVD